MPHGRPSFRATELINADRSTPVRRSGDDAADASSTHPSDDDDGGASSTRDRDNRRVCLDGIQGQRKREILPLPLIALAQKQSATTLPNLRVCDFSY
jgi:hypothetical protein